MKGIIRSTIFTSRHIAQLLIVSRLYFCTNFTTQIPEKKVMGKHRYAKKRTECMWEYTMWKVFFIARQPRTVFMSACKYFSLDPTSNTHQWLIFLSSKHIYGYSFFFLANNLNVILWMPAVGRISFILFRWFFRVPFSDFGTLSRCWHCSQWHWNRCSYAGIFPTQ